MAYRFFLFFLFTLLISCKSDFDEPERVEYTFPLLRGCEDAVRKAEIFFSEVSSNKDYILKVEVTKFDKRPISHSELIGVVKLVSIGHWKTLDGRDPYSYLAIQANGIEADCMADDGEEVDLPVNLVELQSRISGKKSIKTVKVEDKKLIYYFNSGSYTYRK